MGLDSALLTQSRKIRGAADVSRANGEHSSRIGPGMELLTVEVSHHLVSSERCLSGRVGRRLPDPLARGLARSTKGHRDAFAPRVSSSFGIAITTATGMKGL